MNVYLIECGRQVILISKQQQKYTFATPDQLHLFIESTQTTLSLQFEHTIQEIVDPAIFEKFCNPKFNGGGIIAMRDTLTDDFFIYDRHRFKAINQLSHP